MSTLRHTPSPYLSFSLNSYSSSFGAGLTSPKKEKEKKSKLTAKEGTSHVCFYVDFFFFFGATITAGTVRIIDFLISTFLFHSLGLKRALNCVPLPVKSLKCWIPGECALGIVFSALETSQNNLC